MRRTASVTLLAVAETHEYSAASKDITSAIVSHLHIMPLGYYYLQILLIHVSFLVHWSLGNDTLPLSSISSGL